MLDNITLDAKIHNFIERKKNQYPEVDAPVDRLYNELTRKIDKEIIRSSHDRDDNSPFIY